MERERRENQRFACDLEAEIVIGDGTPASRRVVDISRGGIAMVGSEPVAVGTYLTIKLQASSDQGTEALELGATIVWCTQTKDGTYQLGAKFDEAKGRDSARRFDHLLELVSSA